jgi:hypothetical protein
VIEESLYETFVTFENETAALSFSEYVDVNSTLFNNTKVMLQAKTANKESPPSQFLTLNVITFECNGTMIVTPPTPALIEVNFTTFVSLSDEITYSEAVDAGLPMKEGFFDTGIELNCSLDEFVISKVVNSDETLILPADWIEIFVFEPSGKLLTVTNFAGLDMILFKEVRLYFQSKIPGSIDLSAEYHMVTV